MTFSHRNYFYEIKRKDKQSGLSVTEWEGDNLTAVSLCLREGKAGKPNPSYEGVCMKVW